MRRSEKSVVQRRLRFSGLCVSANLNTGFGVFLALLPILVGAQLRHEDSHEHGVGSLNLVVDGDIVSVELTGPMTNFVGFERSPANNEEEARLDEALETLRKPLGLLAFNSEAACDLAKADVRAPESHAQDEQDDGDHGHDHDEASHDEDEDHLEIQAVYEFVCRYPDRLIAVDVGVFSNFPATESIDAQVLGVDSTSVHKLTPGAERLMLRD